MSTKNDLAQRRKGLKEREKAGCDQPAFPDLPAESSEGGVCWTAWSALLCVLCARFLLVETGCRKMRATTVTLVELTSVYTRTRRPPARPRSPQSLSSDRLGHRNEFD